MDNKTTKKNALFQSTYRKRLCMPSKGYCSFLLHYRSLSLFILMVGFCLQSYGAPVVLNKNQGQYNLGHSIEYLKDHDNQYTIAQIASPEFAAKFTQNQTATPSFLPMSGTIWLKFAIENRDLSAKKLFLTIDNSLFQVIFLYYWDDEKQSFQVKKAGRSIPMSKRDIVNRLPAFALEFREKSQTTYYLKLKSDNPITLSILLIDQKVFASNERRADFLSGMYLSVILVMAFYNFFLFFFLRDKIYIYYIANILLMNGIFLSSVFGLWDEYLFPDFSWFQERIFQASKSIGFFFFFLFSQHFLGIKRYRRLNSIINLIKYINIGFFIISIFYIHSALTLISSSAIFLGIIILFVFSGYIFSKGQKYIRFYFVAWFPFLLPLLLGAFLRNSGLIAYFPAIVYLVIAGAALEAVLNSLALGDRINLLREEKTKQMERSEEQIKNLNKSLEERLQEKIRAESLISLEKERAETASRAKTAFITNISHELRTPLNSIIGFSSLLLNAVFDEINHKQKKALERIKKSGEHLLMLINDLLDISLIESGKLPMNKETVDLAAVVTDAIKMHEAQAKDKSIEITENVVNLHHVYADKRRILQVMINLLTNALKFTPKGGKIGVIGENRADTIEITVWDTGIGIAKDRQEIIFEKFEQVENNLSRIYSGIGIGLYFSKEIVTAHGGKIWLESEPKMGSRFTFSIPIKEKVPSVEDMQGDKAPIPSNEGNEGKDDFQCKCLVVEDDRLNRKLIKEILASHRWKIIEATSGKQGLQLAQHHQPDIILLDIGLPDITGIEVLTELKKNPKTQNTTVIAVTAFATNEERIFLANNAFDGYISKPIEIANFMDAIKSIWDNRYN